MKGLSVDKIRNFAFIGHGGAGKTSLGEALLYKAGVTNRLGSVDQGNSMLDFSAEEQRRKVSINLAVSYFEWNKKWMNMVDTPGYLDFAGEVYAALRVVDNAVVVVDAASGVEVGTEKYWEAANRRNLPRIIFVNKCKTPDINLDQVVSELKETFGNEVVPFQIPIGSGPDFKCVFDLLNGDPSELPDELKEEAEARMEELKESVIELSEELMEKYFEGEEISKEEFNSTLRQGIVSGNIIPVLFGEAKDLIGVEELLNFIAEFGASPADLKPEIGKKGDEEVEIIADPDGPMVAFVFKTFSELHVGELYFIRMFSGKLEPGTEVLNANLGRTEKVNQIYLVRGRERKETDGLIAGMIGALVKLKETKTGHTLTSKDFPVVLEGIEFPEPLTSVAIIPKSREDEEKVSEGLAKLHDEDPTFVFKYDTELHQTLIYGLGEQHLDVIISKLRDKFNVSVDTAKPKIPYRETIRKPSQGMGRFVKQTGGRGQYGVCYIKIEPLPRGGGFEFEDQIFGGAIPKSYIPSVELGVKKAMEKGVLGAKVVDVKVILYDGKYHPVDSSNFAFEVAGSLAFKDAEEKADPYLLEPVYEVEVIVPDEYMGDVIGDLNARRGRILGMEAAGKMQKIKAHVPLAELYKYSSTLRSITKGRGVFTMKFSHYDEVPREIAQKIVEELTRRDEEEK